MKKLTQTVIVMILSALVMSCASKAKEEKVQAAPEEPDYNLVSVTELENIWELYYSTGDEKYLENIIAYTNTQDLLLKKANENYKQFSKDQAFVEALGMFGVEQKDGYFDGPYDIELFIAYMIRMDDYKTKIQYIYSFFPQDLYVRGVMKSTAFWSLLSNAQENKNTNIAIQKHIPYINEKGRMNYYAMLRLNQYIGFVKSDDGIGAYQNENLFVSVTLVNDINQAFEAWNSVPEDGNPKIKNTVKVDKENDSIAPFIVYYCNNWEEGPVFFDVELANANGIVLSDKGTNIPLIENPQAVQNLFYAALQSYCWTFDEHDKNGNYIVRITIHTATRVIAVFDMDFVIEQ